MILRAARHTNDLARFRDHSRFDGVMRKGDVGLSAKDHWARHH